MTGKSGKKETKTTSGKAVRKSTSSKTGRKKSGISTSKSSESGGKIMVGEKVSDVQRIEALEAMVDDLQSNFLDVKKSLGELFSIGMDNADIKEILSSSIEGEVVGIQDGKIVGWAMNRVDQLSLLSISVYYGGKKIASTLANKNMPEHLSKLHPSGRSFSAILPKQFYDGRARSLQFKAGDVEADLKNLVGPVSFEDGFPLEGSASIDKNGVVKGWAIDLGEPKSPIIVSAYYGEKEVARTLADMKDGSLSSRFGKTNCHHGFTFELPSNLGDGKKRNIRLIASSWGYEILDGPLECKFSRK